MTTESTKSEQRDAANELALTKSVPDSLFVVFIHGFKGTDQTFREFPKRLEHILSETISNVKVECLVFPAYETKGELDKAVVRFADWLTTLTVEREVASGGGAGNAKIVLCGHSMGGLLAADTLREFVNSRPDAQAPLWPKIIACIAFDTPYYGLHPFVVKNSATKYADAAKSIGTLLGSFPGFSAKTTTPPPAAANTQAASGWGGWAGPAAFAVGGAILAGAAAGTAYYRREDLSQGFSWATDHMKYVGNLWDEEGLSKRVEALIDIEDKDGVTFRSFYAILPPSPPAFLNSRTFVVLPKVTSRSFSHFLLAKNSTAPDELQAHMGMFGAQTNDGYYELGLSTAKIIQDAVASLRGAIHKQNNGDPLKRPSKPSAEIADLISL